MKKLLSATFNEAGTYNVTLTVTDSEGQIASDSIEITVEEAPPELPAVEEPATEETEETSCDPSYPDMCIPPPPPTLTCDDIGIPTLRYCHQIHMALMVIMMA